MDNKSVSLKQNPATFDNTFKDLEIKLNSIGESLTAIETLVARFKDFDVNEDLPPRIPHDNSVLGIIRQHDNYLGIVGVRLIDVQRRLESLF